MTSKIQKSLAVILLAAPMLAASAADITYNVDEIIGAGTVVGTITTDGTIGTLKNKDVVAFDLTVTAPNLEDGPSVVISNLNGGLAQYNSGGLSATATTISFNYGGTGYGFFFYNSSNFDYWCGASTGASSCNFEADPAETIGPASDDADADAQVLSEAGVGKKVIASVSAVAEPTTFALFGLGLAGLGVDSRRRAKRRHPAA